MGYESYFKTLNEEVERVYAVAEAARAKGYDPELTVEIPPAHDVAARVEATLGGPEGVAKRIRELQQTLSREEVAFAIAREIAEQAAEKAQDMMEAAADEGRDSWDTAAERAREITEKAADKAVRVALAILTESITAAPLEGISKVRIRGSGASRYLALYLAGPIRAAGGTEAAVTVLIADYVRQVLNLPALVPTDDEVERALEEVELYARNVHLQYPVHPELIRSVAANLPIMLTGEPTEEFEVSGSRDLERIERNQVRGGSVLVLNDGVVGRAAKLAKIVDRLEMPGWGWLHEIAEKMSKSDSSKKESQKSPLSPKEDYLADVIGGRPVFSHPSRKGGFRLRYGRSRNTGLAGVGVHPATMYIVNEFLAPGTHIRTERPGKGSIVAPVDSIEGPIVLLKNGTVKQIYDVDEARRLSGDIKRIIFLGDVLVALGEFLENNHPLVPSGYCEEWWSHDLEMAWSQSDGESLKKALKRIGIDHAQLESWIQSPLSQFPNPAEAVSVSETLGVPLHPRYVYRWQALSVEEIAELRTWILEKMRIIQDQEEGSDRIILPPSDKHKGQLERLGVPHRVVRPTREIELLDNPTTVRVQLGDKKSIPSGSTPLEFVNSCSSVEIRDRLGFSIGARMGRPEKAEVRKMRPAVQVLFPVGRSLGTEREIEKVARANDHSQNQMTLHEGVPSAPLVPGTAVEVVSRACPTCDEETFESRCSKCGSHTIIRRWCSRCGQPIDQSTGRCPSNHDMNLIRATRRIPLPLHLGSYLERIKSEIGEHQTYGLKGVLGLTNEYKIPEYLGKGILRAKHEVYCYRDGTARFDATDAPLTHFIPKEVGVPVSRLKDLGYTTDHNGNSLTSDDQVVELKVQDIIVPEKCADYMVRVAHFVDDCLEKIYGLPPYYEFKHQEDILGTLVIGLAPHTSAGIIGRIIGFTNASVCYAHPYWHAAKRRNCDGDEDALILVMDALINFSKAYLPAGRGGFMDAPLVLSVILNPEEVDDESHNMEVCSRYPAEFYKHVSKATHPREVENLVDIIAKRLDSEAQYEGLQFTHGTSSFDIGPRNTRYKTLGSMIDKLEAQLNLAKLIDAVDEHDVAERVISHHFIRDIRGNLRAYSTQKIQCRRCNRIYRRIPLSGLCECGSPLSLTVSQKNISKYLEISQRIITENGLGGYLGQRLSLIQSALDSLFFSEQTSLEDFFQ
ncbi:DNA polymerase II large subunit [Candidatus Thorarchaeota archaeon]|nr:MAG: DNA polymerase II large subunit [Candidatus Thorarchaeota archaeon]